mmetsp:Transcript_9171/g.28219  ORF Transcript_9171/g.28219 Transcript_9171/m.28219 type:complete len:114 (+) Transcript_9171:468-809(+)
MCPATRQSFSRDSADVQGDDDLDGQVRPGARARPGGVAAAAPPGAFLGPRRSARLLRGSRCGRPASCPRGGAVAGDRGREVRRARSCPGRPAGDWLRPPALQGRRLLPAVPAL